MSLTKKIIKMKENINTFGLFNVVSLIKLIVKRKIFFLILIVVSALLSILISSPIFIKPLYKSEAIIYPSNIKPTSEESPTEQMMQYLESNAIKDSVIKYNHLAEHWKIDKDHPNYNFILLKTFDEYINFKETRFESVRIEALDKDPKKAYEIINSVLYFFDSKVEENRIEKYSEIYTSSLDYINNKCVYLDSIKRRLDVLKTDFEIYDYGSLSNELVEGILGTVDGSDKINHANVKRIGKNFQKYGTESMILQNNLFIENNKLLEFKFQNFEGAKYEISRRIKHYELITSPRITDKKAYPVRWLIVLSGVIGSFITFVLFFLIYDNRDYFKNLYKN